MHFKSILGPVFSLVLSLSVLAPECAFAFHPTGKILFDRSRFADGSAESVARISDVMAVFQKNTLDYLQPQELKCPSELRTRIHAIFDQLLRGSNLSGAKEMLGITPILVVRCGGDQEAPDAGASDSRDVVEISSGLISVFQSDSEVAFVLAHELAHSSQAHDYRWDWLKERGPKTRFEKAADEYGLEIHKNAGYLPADALRAVERMMEVHQGAPNPSDWDHDAWDVRLADLKKEIADHGY